LSITAQAPSGQVVGVVPKIRQIVPIGTTACSVTTGPTVVIVTIGWKNRQDARDPEAACGHREGIGREPGGVTVAEKGGPGLTRHPTSFLATEEKAGIIGPRPVVSGSVRRDVYVNLTGPGP
jgi:hypothetical protein